MTFFLEDPVGQNWFQPIIVQNIEHHGPTCGDGSWDRGFGSQEVQHLLGCWFQTLWLWHNLRILAVQMFGLVELQGQGESWICCAGQAL